MNLAIRLTRSAFMLENFFRRLPDICEQTIWYEHHQDHKVSRTHCHGVIIGCKVSVETLKNWLMYETTQWDRSSWSFKKSYKVNGILHDVDLKFIIYMSKGQHDPVYNHNVSNVNQYKDAWIERSKVQSDIRDFTDPDRKEDQKTRWEMLQEIKRRMSLFEYETSTSQLIETIVDVFRHNKVIMSRYKVRDMYDSYMAYEKPHAFIFQLESLCTGNKNG